MSRLHASNIWIAATLVMAAAAALQSCSFLAPVKDVSRYFVLTPEGEMTSAAPGGSGGELRVGLGPLNLPGYLERRELVTRIAGNQLRFSPDELWAEPLPGNFAQVLAQELSNRLDGARIVMFPWYSSTRLDYSVALDLSHFECDGARDCLLSGELAIGDGRGQILHRDHVYIVSHAEAPGGDATAAALSRDVAQLSAKIAKAIGALAENESRRARQPTVSSTARATGGNGGEARQHR